MWSINTKSFRGFGTKLRVVPALGYACAAIAMMTVIALVLLIRNALIIPNAGVLYLLVVIASAIWLGTGPAVLALLLALIAIAYVYAPIDANPAVTAARLVVISAALAIGVIIGRLVRRERARAVALAEEADVQRRRFQTVVENAPAGIAVLRGSDFVFELINPAYQAIAPGKKMLGRTVAEVWPELADQVLPLLNRVLRIGEPYHAADVPLPVQRTAEAPVAEAFFTFAYVPMRSIEGRVDAILVLVVETTEQARARERIEELAEIAGRRAAELQAILDNMVDGVYVCDEKGRITIVNAAGMRLLGLTDVGEVRRALGESPEQLRIRRLGGRPIAPAEQPLARAIEGQTVVQEEQLVYNPLRERDIYVRISASPIRDEQREIVGAVAVANDVTELVELDKLKDSFISVAAHELKTPVAIMKGYAQALLRLREGVPERQRRMLEAIDRGANRIDAIVMDLLDISRLQIGHLELTCERVDLLALVSQVVDRMEFMARKHHVRLVGAEPAEVSADRGRIEQVLVDLLDNAIKYSPKGGDVDVAVAIEDGEAVVSVRDYGVGIPKEKQAHIFQRFYSAHGGTPYDYGGMAVGLYISKEIIARHGGRMWFESEEGKGSTFYFSLPIS